MAEYLDYDGLGYLIQKLNDSKSESGESMYISDDIKELYGLGPNATLDSVLRMIYIVSIEGFGLANVLVVDENGEPLKKCVVNVIKSSGNISNAETNLDGIISFKVESNETVTVEVHSCMLDIEGSVTFETLGSSTAITSETLHTSFKSFTKLTSTIQGRFSSSCISASASLTGGGGGGGGGSTSGSGASAGGGGGGGHSIIIRDLSFDYRETYPITVGSGGSGGSSSGGNGYSGGETTAFGESVSGGNGGKGGGNSLSNAGIGNGKGGASSAASGTAGTEYYFADEDNEVLCGGGGGAGRLDNSSTSGLLMGDSFDNTYNGGNGGSPYGGKGGSVRVIKPASNTSVYIQIYPSSGSSGSDIGGGGGGGSTTSFNGSVYGSIGSGGYGHSGCVSIRFVH